MVQPSGCQFQTWLHFRITFSNVGFFLVRAWHMNGDLNYCFYYVECTPWNNSPHLSGLETTVNWFKHFNTIHSLQLIWHHVFRWKFLEHPKKPMQAQVCNTSGSNPEMEEEIRDRAIYKEIRARTVLWVVALKYLPMTKF